MPARCFPIQSSSCYLREPDPGHGTGLSLFKPCGAREGIFMKTTWQEKMKSFWSGKNSIVILTLAPLLIFFLIFWLLPMVFTFAVSFTDWSPVYPGQGFVGVANFTDAFSERGIGRLWNTFYFSLGSVPIRTALGLAIALMLNSVKRFRPFYRTVYFIPVVTSLVAATIMWRWIYQPQFGLLNQIIDWVAGWLHVRIPRIRWLLDPNLAMPSLIIMEVWKNLGYNVVLYLAGLQTIPAIYYEAARVDGAKGRHLLRYITLPLLGPTTLFVVVIGAIGAMQVFVPIYVLTGGWMDQGADHAVFRESVVSIVFWIYLSAFVFFKYGYASSLAAILFVIIMFFTLIQMRLLRTEWEY
jgi:multiple sugar transport system permease protein